MLSAWRQMRSDFYVFLMKLQLATTTTVASCRRLRRIGDFHKWEPKHLFLDFHVTLSLFIVVGSTRVALTSRTTQKKRGERRRGPLFALGPRAWHATYTYNH